jgi:hypothetical protein
MSEKKICVYIEYGDLKAKIESYDINDAFRIISDFFAKIPAFEIASKLAYSPDITKIVDGLTGITLLLPSGPIIEPQIEPPTREAIGLCLLTAYASNRLGKLEKDTLSAEHLARGSRKAVKTIRNELPSMISTGLVERVGKGEYRITDYGIKFFLDEILPKYKVGEKK